MFVPAEGLDYRDFLDALHQQLRFGWYLEIGTETGLSLAKSRSPSVAVDPTFKIRHNVARNKARLHLFQETSDEFFQAKHLKTLKIRPDFSFLDGMHLFEYLLRDFMHAEAEGTEGSVIALHDCCPFGHGMTTRDTENRPRGPWTGDVWKLIPILQEHRPDLAIRVFDCAPTGLVVISNLDPKSTILRRAYDRIVARYRDLSLTEFGVDRFYGSFTYADARAEAAAGFPTFRPAAKQFFPPEPAFEGATPIPPARAAEARALPKLTVHGVDLYFGHRILRDVARDLTQGITRPLAKPVDVYVGVHKVDQPLQTGRFRIGIQTEHFYRADGKRAWRLPRERFRNRYALFYDVLLDLSHENIPGYDFLPPELRSKITFGPHIFPDTPIAPRPADGAPLFFGSLNERRRALIAALQALAPLEVAPHGTYGRPLNRMIERHGSVLNLHLVDGAYNEYPRLLKAYLAGKPLLSEPLAPPLRVGEHYFDLNAEPTADATAALFNSLAAFAARHSFQAFLESALADLPAWKAG